MPIHDWTRVEAGTYHAFHLAWLGELQKSLNGGRLPAGYYALAEQRANDTIPDVLALHESDPLEAQEPPEPEGGGGATLTKSRPAAQERLVAPAPVRGSRRTMTIRSTTGHRIIAFVEIVWPSNKDRLDSVTEFAAKVRAALTIGVHVLMIDPFPAGSSDPAGMHAEVWRRISGGKPAPRNEHPLAFAAYLAAKPFQAFVNRLAIGDAIPDMPLFLTRTKYVDVPLESTYMAAYSGMPDFWRKVIEAKPA